MSAPQRAVPLVAPGHTRPVTHLSFSPLLDDGTYLLISSCKDGNPMLREWTGDWIGTFVGHKGAVWSTKLSRDGSRAASGSADFTAKIWDTYSGQMLHSFPHNHIVRSVAISPDPLAGRLLTGGQEKKVRIFDMGKTDAEPDVLSEGGGQSHDGTVKSVVWLDENIGVSAGDDGFVKWWDARARQVTKKIFFDNPITSMELSSQTQRLVVTSGKTVNFIPAQPAETRTPTHSVKMPYTPSSASVHPILQDRFVTGSTSDEWVRVHRINGEELEVLKGHHGPVHCVEYSPDGEVYASGSVTGTIRLWQTTPGKTYGLWQGATSDGG
ncbi:WD40 repeat-like protein [Russula earlei]|uniref:WD40 repeat-like protein n=1 Tax=Russula earlei TaxID=71964 RepID=A0ACC0UBL9_9AGAM|nr:WD40 repeat-like protein [Russula earlei]